MPLYEYRCKTCGTVFDVLQKFSDEPLTTHSGCGGTVERVLCPPALQFKGTGWYVTDYAHKSGSNGSGSGKHASKPAQESAKPAATPAKTDSTPAKK